MMNTISHNRLARISILLWVFSIIVEGCTGPSSPVPFAQAEPTPSPSAYWPTQVWRTSTPEEQGMDSGRLSRMLASIDQESLDLHSLLIIRHGTIVSETYFQTYHQDTPHELYSVTKSFISTLIGIAIDQGSIDGVDHLVLDYFRDKSYGDQDTLKKAITLENLLTMTTGLDWQEEDIYPGLYQSHDWVSYVLRKPMLAPPGSQFNYCSGCSHILSAILQQATQMNTMDFAQKTLFEPLGITHVTWETDPKGTPIGGWGLQLTPRDMAKLGYLYLHEGKWGERQIVSSEWVRRATQKHTATDDDDLGYGYQWWIYPGDKAYVALGLYGQTIFVAPDLDLIVVTTAGSLDHDKIFPLIEKYILPAVGIRGDRKI